MSRFTEILAQDGAVSYLRRTARSRKIPTAFLFSGPSGCGRRLAARAFAFAASCLDAEYAAERGSCGVCDACRANAHGEGYEELDIGEIFLRKESKVETLREELRRFRMTHRLRWKIVAVDGADLMNETMQAAMLKAVEEPAENVSFALIAVNPERISATLRSRTVPVRFRPLPDDAVARILSAQGIALTSAGRALIACAGGSLEVARQMIDEFAAAPDFEKDFIRAISGRSARHDLLERLRRSVPVLARLHPEWTEPLVQLDSAVARNANISLATALFRAKTGTRF